jgi:hypothetical protein
MIRDNPQSCSSLVYRVLCYSTFGNWSRKKTIYRLLTKISISPLWKRGYAISIIRPFSIFGPISCAFLPKIHVFRAKINNRLRQSTDYLFFGCFAPDRDKGAETLHFIIAERGGDFCNGRKAGFRIIYCRIFSPRFYRWL